MQLRIYISVLLCTTLFSFTQKEHTGTPLNLVPNTVNRSPDYWCTWGAQNYASDTVSLIHSLSLGGHSVTAGYLTEERLFGEGGWSPALRDQLKEDLILLFDLGWDVPPDQEFDDSRWKLGSLEVDTDKFPSCKGEREEKLACLNQMVTAHGWKGTGIWLPSHPHEDYRYGEPMADSRVRDFYRVAVKHCAQAGIKYLKIDYGYRGGDIDFRSMLTEMVKVNAPGILVEHGRGGGPLNDERCPWDTENYHQTGRYRNWDDGKVLETAVAMAGISHVLRTYDITQQLSIPTTLDRVCQLLYELSGTDTGVIINCEDEPYMAAVLGCAMGILRHPDMIMMEGYHYDPFHFSRRIDEVVRAVKWHRIAPAWAAGESDVFLDTMILADNWLFAGGDGWATWMIGKEVVQAAPARVARGLPLPGVKFNGEPPYVVCSKHPNGPVAVGTLPRISSECQIYYPVADVTLEMGDPYVPVGIFGRYGSLKLRFDDPVKPDSVRIYGQDLASEIAVDLTGSIRIHPSYIIIPGELIEETGLSGSSGDDLSEPGMVLRILRTGQSENTAKKK